ncbi:MAG: bacteriochlorophyll c-binding protein [Chlorobiales bacterium]|jgi:hypothetical protein|nr:bacteriochlorophyll c-binding protein [Chlorobiales bacterium]
MVAGGGAITDVLSSIGRISETMFEGHWHAFSKAVESLAQGSLRLNQNLWGSVGGGVGSSLRGSSPSFSGYADRSKEIESKFAK